MTRNSYFLAIQVVKTNQNIFLIGKNKSTQTFKTAITKNNPRKNLFPQGKAHASASFPWQGKAHASASFPWLIKTWLQFEHLKSVGLGHDLKCYKMVEVMNWICCNICVTKYWVSKCYFVLAKQLWNEMKKKGNKRKKTNGRFPSTLQPLVYHYLKWRSAETKIRFHRFRNVIIPQLFAIIPNVLFPREEKFSCLSVANLKKLLRVLAEISRSDMYRLFLNKVVRLHLAEELALSQMFFGDLLAIFLYTWFSRTAFGGCFQNINIFCQSLLNKWKLLTAFQAQRTRMGCCQRYWAKSWAKLLNKS